MATQRAREYLVDFEIATNPDYDPNWHHDVIAKELEHIEKHGDRDYKILVLTVPPRNGKSQQCSIDFPAWMFGKDQEQGKQREVIVSSYSADLALKFGGDTREKVDSDAYKAIFPQVVLKVDEKAKGQWKTNKGSSYTAAGVGGPITGKGADIFIVDDPLKNREEAESEVMREKVWTWWTSTAFTRLSPHGVMIVIMTRWHTDDLVGRILASEEFADKVKLIKFPAIANTKEPNRSIGMPLWPSRFNLQQLATIKSVVGPYDWNALYQCDPVTSEEQEFRPSWLKSIEEAVVQSMNCRRVLTIDPAMSKKSAADRTGFCDNRINDQNFWHLKAWGARLSPEELVSTIFNLHLLNRYDAIGIERTSYLDGLKPFIDAEQRRRNIFLPLKELKHNQQAKEIRIRGLQPRYASGSVFHIKGECTLLEEEMRTFPVGVHDDVLDATAYQEQMTLEEHIGGMSVRIPDYD